MKLISKSVVDINFSIPNFLNEKGYSQNFDYIRYRYDGDLPVDVYVLFTNDNYFIFYIEENTLHIYQSTGKHLASDVLKHFD
ncbi:hypothetical protein [Aerococcus viridans]|uniref:hypothetical protein n=1 Tax=Aerococcus viridans TaxID=1377 RepID=UPI0039B0EB68